MPKKQNRPNMKQVYLSNEATQIVAQMPKREASRAISAAIVAMFSPDEHKRRMAVLTALLYDAELDTVMPKDE
jgi:hypothetical protein